MSLHLFETLEGQLAQRLFGWRWEPTAQLWRDPDGVYRDAATFRRRLPAYTTDPAATARVWQWVERQAPLRVEYIKFDYYPTHVTCGIEMYTPDNLYAVHHGRGPTWPEALCRAALALAEAFAPPPPAAAGEEAG